MASYTLNAEPPVGFEKRQFDNLQLIEVLNLSIVSIAFSNNILPKFKKLILNKLKINIPNVGGSNFSDTKGIRLIALQQDQIFAVYEEKSNNPINEIKSILGDEFYYSDQSDSWSITNISGDNTISALERICPLSLAIDSFKINDAHRTLMEHISVIILRINKNEFLLFSPRSTSNSFFHTLINSAEYIS